MQEQTAPAPAAPATPSEPTTDIAAPLPKGYEGIRGKSVPNRRMQKEQGQQGEPLLWFEVLKEAGLPSDPEPNVPDGQGVGGMEQASPAEMFRHKAEMEKMEAQKSLIQTKSQADVQGKEMEMQAAKSKAGLDSMSSQQDSMQQQQQAQQQQAPTNPAVNPSPQQPLGSPQQQASVDVSSGMTQPVGTM